MNHIYTIVLTCSIALSCFSQNSTLNNAEALLLKENFNGALEQYEALIEETQDMSSSEVERMIHGYAAAALGSKKYSLAESLYALYLRTFPEGYYVDEIRYRQARLTVEQRPPLGAIVSLKEFVQQNPESPYVPNAFFWVADIFAENGYSEDASTMFQRVYTEYPDSYFAEEAQERHDRIVQASQNQGAQFLLENTLEQLIDQSTLIKGLEEKQLSLLQKVVDGEDLPQSELIEDITSLHALTQTVSDEIQAIIRRM